MPTTRQLKRKMLFYFVMMRHVCGDVIYGYMSLSCIGALYNTSPYLRDAIQDLLRVDKRINYDSCSCNICDGFHRESSRKSPISRHAILLKYDSTIHFTCRWRCEIFREMQKNNIISNTKDDVFTYFGTSA